MASTIDRVKAILSVLNFEYQETSFEMLVSSGELTILGKLIKLPECDSSKILLCFPHLFVFHRTASPKKGSFFIRIESSLETNKSDFDYVYRKYFPKAVLIVSYNAERELLAHWFHSSNKSDEITLFLKSVLR